MEMLHEYQVSQVLDIKKFVKVCLHFSYAVQISLQFDDFFNKNLLRNPAQEFIDNKIIFLMFIPLYFYFRFLKRCTLPLVPINY